MDTFMFHPPLYAAVYWTYPFFFFFFFFFFFGYS